MCVGNFPQLRREISQRLGLLEFALWTRQDGRASGDWHLSVFEVVVPELFPLSSTVISIQYSKWEAIFMAGPGINRYRQRLFILLLLITCWTDSVFAQDLEPRRWSQIPTGVNFIGVGYGYIQGDIFFDPVLQIEDASFKKQLFALSYVRSFSMFGRSARADITLPYGAGRWAGLLAGEAVSVRRRGLGDARVRLSTLLYGGPAQTPQEFATSKQSDTVVGAAIALTMPTGEYSSERLINLGLNQWIVRPQLGITHSRGKWTGEVTGSVFIYSDNNKFFQSTELEADPLFAMQAHLIYTFRPGLWASLSTAYGWGGEATVNGDAKKNPAGNWLNALSFGLPINRTQGIKISYLMARTQKPTGADNDRLVLAYSMMF